MKLKYLIILLIFICSAITVVIGQTGPGNTEQDTLNIFIGTGRNQILIPASGAALMTNPAVQVVSENPALLEVIQTSYTPNSSFALVLVEEKGTSGTSVLSLTIEGDGTLVSSKMAVRIAPYNNPGMIFEIHDIVFWQEAIPLTTTAVFDTIIHTSQGPYSNLNYKNIPITVNMDCNTAVCTGHDFYTSLYKGYIIPPADGEYTFYMQSADRHTLWLSANEKFTEAKKIIARSSSHGTVGTEVGGGRTKSAPQQLKAGKVYAIYATQWIIHSTVGGILWEGPGIATSYIPGKNMMPFYDVVKPTAPGNLKTDWRTSTQVSVSWNPSTDNNKVSGYNIYLNGIRKNTTTIRETTYLIKNLEPDTSHFIVATAIDPSGNESFISNILEAVTHKTDTLPPTPPASLEVLQATGLAVSIRWAGATDNETEVIGYNIYVDGSLFNTTGLHYSDNIVIRNLIPETSYSIAIEAVDAGLNVSEKSELFTVSTVGFDPLGPALGENRATFMFHLENTSWNEGIGLNGPYENGDMVNNARVRQLVKDFQAGAIRWGAISANSKSFAGSVGTGKQNTYGKMLNLANEMDAWFALTVGVQNGIDYRTEPKTFLYLLEYLAGDPSTTWGAVRASEGFTEPLLQKGKGILLEFGNEVWGAAAHDAEIGSDYTKYAQWVREMTDVVRSSPYYDPEKIVMVYSGRYPHPDSSYGVNTRVLTGDRGHAESLAVSGYLGGNLSYDPEIPAGKSELDYYKSGIDMARNNMNGLVLTMKETLSLTGTLKTFYLYESNMTTGSYNGRFGQGIVMLDYMVNSMNYGSIVPTIFHLTGGQWRITQPADNYRELPLYTMGKYFNRFSKGHILHTELITNNTITNANRQVINYSPVGAYAFNNKEQFSLLLVNRDFEYDYTIQLKLPEEFEFTSDATIYTLWENNFSSFNAYIDSVTTSLTDGMLLKVPKHAMVIISVKGEDPGFVKTPHGYYNRKRPESLIINTTRNGIINTNRGTEVITPLVLPADAFSTGVVYNIIENTTQSILTPLSNSRLHIRASGVCGDNGEMKIVFYASDNHDLRDTVIIRISNQGTDCPVTSISNLVTEGGILFSPNPVNDRLILNPGIDGLSTLEIHDSIGRLVISKRLEHTHEVPVKSLKPGLYILTVTDHFGIRETGKFQKL
jgi:hypothetical protein